MVKKSRLRRDFAVPADAIVECRACGAPVAVPCKRQRGEALKKGMVHIGRRISRLLLTAKAPFERERIEAELVEALEEELAARAETSKRRTR